MTQKKTMKSKRILSPRADAFWAQLILTGSTFMAVVLGAVSSPGEANYTYVQNSLFAGALLIILLFVLTKKDHREMLIPLRKLVARPIPLELEDWTHILRLLMFAAAIACFFVLDFGELGAGFRVGGVAAVGLFRILTGLMRKGNRSDRNSH